MQGSSSLLRIGAVSALVLAGIPAAQARSYRVVDLGKDKVTVQINKQGDIAGNVFGSLHALAYRGDKWHRLPDLGQTSVADAINAGGDVVGTMRDFNGSEGFAYPVMWPRGSVPVQLALPDGSQTGWPTAIAADQTVVGEWTPAGGTDYHCFRWTPPATSIDLGMMAHGHECRPNDINRHGQIVGGASVTFKGYPRAFLYENGHFRNLGIFPGGDRSTATAINDRGHIVGIATVDSNGGVISSNYGPFLWSGGTMKALPMPPNFTATWATSISNNGEIVGHGFSFDDNENHALRFADGAAILLESEVEALDDWKLERATSVNEHGAIVGWGSRSDGIHAFMLVPVSAD